MDKSEKGIFEQVISIKRTNMTNDNSEMESVEKEIIEQWQF